MNDVHEYCRVHERVRVHEYICVYVCVCYFVSFSSFWPNRYFHFFCLVRLPNCNYGICIHECMCACVCLKYTELQMKLWAVFSVIRLSSGFLIGSNNIQSYVYRCKDSRNVANVLNHNLLTSHRISIICQVLRSRVYFHCPLYPKFQYKKEKKSETSSSFPNNQPSVRECECIHSTEYFVTDR